MTKRLKQSLYWLAIFIIIVIFFFDHFADKDKMVFNTPYQKWFLLRTANKLVGKIGGSCKDFAILFTTIFPETKIEIIETQYDWKHWQVIFYETEKEKYIIDGNRNLDNLIRITKIKK